MALVMDMKGVLGGVFLEVGYEPGDIDRHEYPGY
jgi:hypothetical protein